MRIVLLGGGHAHVAALRALGRRAVPGASLLLLSRAPDSLYSGMLPGLIRRDHAVADARMAPARLAAHAGATFLQGEAVGVDLSRRIVACSDGREIGFDILSLDLGGVSTPLPDTLPLRPIEGLPARIAALEAEPPGPAPVLVAGGGPAGVELALALAWRWRGGARRVALLTRGAAVLPEAPRGARSRALRALAEAGVAVRCGAAVEAAGPGAVRLADGTRLATAATLWATGAAAPPWLAGTGLAVDADGCVRVDAALRSVSHPFVLAAGDCAASDRSPRPKGGVWAVRAGPPLAATLRAMAQGRPPPAWVPQRRALTIVGLGGGRALAWRGGWWAAGRLPWHWKTWLDRQWMRGAAGGAGHGARTRWTVSLLYRND